MTAVVELHHDGAVATVSLHRPERRNALDHAALEDLLGALEQVQVRVADDFATRVVVLTGSDGHFCAGADLSTLEDSTYADLLRRALHGLRDLQVPVIAAVEGAALGAGTQLASACDLRVATDDATFGIPAVRLGVVVDLWTIARLASDWGTSTARAMLVGGLTCSGADAHRLGFVARLGSPADAAAWAQELAERAPLTMKGHKAGLTALEAVPSEADAFAEAFTAAWSSQDLRDGVEAFRSKQTPTFRGH